MSTSDLLVPQARQVNLSSLLEEKSDLIVLDRGSKIRSLWRSIPCVTRAKLSLLGESKAESRASTAFGATFVSCLALNWFLPISFERQLIEIRRLVSLPHKKNIHIAKKKKKNSVSHFASHIWHLRCERNQTRGVMKTSTIVVRGNLNSMSINQIIANKRWFQAKLIDINK
jgi:hypothetical protein